MLEFWDETHPNCEKCGLYEKCKSPFMPVSGEGKAKILIVAEAPGAEEDSQNTQLVGDAGDELRQTLDMLGYDLDEDFWKTNAIICRPPNNKTPSKTQIKMCRRNLEKTIQELQPKAVFLFGNTPNEMLLGDKLKTTAISSISGTMIPLTEHNTWAFPLFHPSFVLRKKWDKNLKAHFKRELRNALENCEELPDIPDIDPYENVTPIFDKEDSVELLEWILKTKPLTAFDYETSGTKPYKKGHDIYCVGISTKEESWSFLLKRKSKKPMDKKIVSLFKKYLKSPKLKKVCHNAQYEYIWSTIILNAEPKGIIWCTMVTQHMIDNRPGITSLKHQAAARWGIHGYDAPMDKFIKSTDDKDPHSFNKMHKAPIEPLLLYCGTDAALTMRLYFEQLEEVPDRMKEARKFFHMGALLFARMSMNGIKVDVEYYREKDAELGEKIKAIDEEIMESQEVISYENKYGKEFLSTSSPVLREFFFDHLKLKSEKKTGKGNKSVDEEALRKLNHWIGNRIIEKRGLEKLKNTYIGQMLREAINGKVHTDLTLHIARTFRSSSLSPNTQNWPKRDPEAMAMIRAGIIPEFDRLLEPDFSSAEVITAASYNKDRNLIKYLEDDDADMHRDMACDLYKATADMIVKPIRKAVKPATFGFFYGSYYELVGPSMFEVNIDKFFKDGTAVKEHLKKHKIGTKAKFTKHVKDVEDKFWNERFYEYKEWKETINEEYRENGEIWTYLGFRYIGYMDFKQIGNYPIQGTSFHLLLYTLIVIEKWLKKNNMKTKLCLEVHDSGIFDSPEDEYIPVAKKFKEITAKFIYKFDFLEVPMDSEPDVSEKDGNFAEMKGLEV